MRCRGLCVVIVALSTGRSPAAADWPNFRGPAHDGISPETGISKDWTRQPPTERWRVSLSTEGYAGPCAAAGAVYLIDHAEADDVVRALDLKTGEERWRFAYRDTRVGHYGFAKTTPAYDDGRLYTVSHIGLVHCLDARRGTKIWSVDMIGGLGGRKPFFDYSISPVICGSRLIVCPGGADALVAAIDKITGEVIWRGGGGDIPGYSTPVPAMLRGRQTIVVFTGESLIGVDASGGALAWRVQWRTRYRANCADPVVMGDRVFITSSYRRGCALVGVDEGGAQITWQNQEIRSHFSSAIASGGYVYSTSDHDWLVCVEADTGRAAWRERGFDKGGLIAVDGALIVVHGDTGDVAMVEMSPERYRELGRIRPLGGRSWTAPIVADGALILRNLREMTCLELR